jgi:hypothetical protein
VIPFDEASLDRAQGRQDWPFGNAQSRVGKRGKEKGIRNRFSVSLVAVFGGEARRYKTSRLVFLELCELKNNSDAGAKGKATGLLRLTRRQAD